MWLRSDNAAGVSEEILDALVSCNAGVAAPYGDDDLSRQLDARLSAVFETPVVAYMVPSGTAANALALSSIAGPFDMIVCHQEAHAFGSECGATDMFSGGARFKPVPGAHGRIDAAAAADMLAGMAGPRDNTYRLGALTVTQLTEAGTLYQPADLGALGALARKHGLRMHMDGARFANALAALAVHPADITWRVGVDVLSFGATKNGAMYADAVVFFDPALAEHFKRRLKRSGHDLSKTRFMAAQLLRYLEYDLWLRNARHANAVARELGELLARVPGADILHPVEGNIVFAALPDRPVQALAAAGIQFRSRGRLADGREWFRLVPSFRTDPQEVRALRRPLGL